MEEKEYTYDELGCVLFRKSPKARRVSIRVHPLKGVIVTVPKYASYAVGEAFLDKKKDWVVTAIARQKERIAADTDEEYIERLRLEAKAVLPDKLNNLAEKYGFSFRKVTIKHNRSNWGSCSRLGNINLNLNLMRLSSELQTYVMLHELCHLRYLNHGKSFHNLLERLCDAEIGPSATGTPSYKLMEKELKNYILV